MAERDLPTITDALWIDLLLDDPNPTAGETSPRDAVRHLSSLYAAPVPGAARERARQRVFEPIASTAKENTMTAVPMPISLPGWNTPTIKAPPQRSMHWRRLSIAVVLLILLASLGSWFAYEYLGSEESSPAVIPAVQSSPTSDWPMYRGNPARTGSSASFGPSELPVEYWRFPTGVSADSAPAVVGTTVYLGSSDGVLRAIDALTGKELWHFQGDASMENAPSVIDGVVYLSSGVGTLYAVDAQTGEERWTFGVATSEWGLSVERDGVLYAGSEDGNLYAIDAATGDERWHVSTGGPVLYSQALDGAVVYTGSNDGLLYAIEADDGSIVWTFDTGQQTVGAPAVSDGVVYVRRTSGGMFAIDAATGEQRFLIEGPAAGNFTQASVAGDSIFLGAGDGTIVAFSTVDGSNRWTFEAGESFTASPVIANGIVYAASDRGAVFAIDAQTGTELWRFAVGGKVEVGPALSDGVLYLSTSNGDLVAFGDPSRNPLQGTPVGTAESSPIAVSGFDASAIEVVWQTAPEFLTSPGPLAVAPNGDLYVLDLSTDTVQIFGPDGEHIGSMGGTGSEPGQFVFHRGQEALGNIGIDADGNLYVFDTYNSRVQKFAPDGTFLLEWGQPGSGNGDIDEATGGVDPRTGTVYATDLNDRVQVFDSEGNFLDRFGSSGAGPGKFLKPLAVAVDSQGNIYVGQEENGPVQVFDRYGQYLRSIVPPEGSFSLVLSMALDADDNLFVANYNGNVIQIFDPAGELIGEISELPGAGTLLGPVGVGFDSEGNLYISGEGNHRLVKVALPALP